MLVIELQFPAGRYHGTPWGRNVNEGEVEWPPSPYRLARALVDVWKRRKSDWPEARLHPLLEALSAPVRFHLPPASAAHTRSYLSSNERDPTKKQLVFDAFVVLERNTKVLMGLDCDVETDAVRDLETLLAEFNYLGRSESWIRAKITKRLSTVKWNCLPMFGNTSFQDGESVRVACLLPRDGYDKLPYVPETYDWVQAVCLTTKDLLGEGWSDPPALQWVDYTRRADALRPSPGRRLPHLRTQFCCAKYALSSKVLPRVQDTVPFAERVRTHLMGIHKRIRNNDPALVSPLFSGKGSDGKPLGGHRHVFYRPLDEDGDGRLDHLLVHAVDPFNNSELTALDRLCSVWQPDRRPDINLVLVALSAEVPGLRSSRWVSATPFVTSRHYRKGRGTYEEWLSGEIARECAFHKLPSPTEVQWIPHNLNTSRPTRWMEFVRSRKNRPPLRGHGCILIFDKPVSGPFALGSGCHFGLGLFVPYGEQ